MALTLNNFVGFETGGLEEAIATSGSPAAAEDQVYTGDYSLKFTNSVVDYYDVRIIAGGSSDGGNKYVFGGRWRISGGSGTFLQVYDSSGLCFDLRVSGGKISAYDANGSLIETGTTSVSVDQWYLIEIVWNHSDSGTFDLHLDKSSELSQTGKDLSAGGSMDDDAAVYRLKGHNTSGSSWWDDVYCYSGASGTGDFLGDPEVFRYQANTNSATPDSGDNLTAGVWQNLGQTPMVSDEAEYETPSAGYIYTDDTASGKYYRHGPHGDGNIDGTIEGAKWIWSLKTEGGGAGQGLRYGNDVDGVVAEAQALTSSYATYVRIREDGYVPTVDQHFAIGFYGGTKKSAYCQEMWGMLLHVPPAGPPPPGQPVQVRTVGVPTGSGYRTRPGSWN